MKNDTILSKLIDRAPLLLVLVGLFLVIIAAAKGWPNPSLQVDEVEWRVTLAVLGIIVVFLGGLLLWRETEGPDKSSPTIMPCDTFGIRIISPKAGEEVGIDYEISGTYKVKPPESRVIQIFQGPPGTSEYWPMTEANITFDVNRKTWHSHAHTGGGPGPRDVIVTVSGKAGQALCSYYEKVGKETGQWPSIVTLTPDIVECDRITIVRKSESGRTKAIPQEGNANLTRENDRLHTIRFDYSDSPSLHGWHIGSVTPSFRSVTDGFFGSALEIRATQKYAMDYYLDDKLRKSSYLEFVAQYAENTVVYARITIRSKDSSKLREGWLAFLLGSGESRPAGDGTEEWTVFISPTQREGKWSIFKIDLRDAVASSYGRDGWIFKHLDGFRLRGDLTIAHISVYK
jgi:hypothetical protein